MAAGFRHDVNGLRALAVVGVMLFHFQVAGFTGGFSGVDVFYVISGFLMTQIVLRQTQQGRLGVLKFYRARVERIVPALLALCVVVVVLGLVLVDPLAYPPIAEAAVASLLFLSNFLFASQQGYFAPEAHQNWLLHTWSLSVEWQFYLIYPVVLALLQRSAFAWNRLGWILLAGMLLSLAGAIIVSSVGAHYEKWAFFMLPTRAWEMLAGGVVAYYGGRLRLGARSSLALELCGLVLIVVSAVALHVGLQWPSYWTILPVAGAAAVIAAARTDAWWARLPPVFALGRWSYSIYLWHWPLFVGVMYLGLDLTVGAKAALLLLSIALGAFSYEAFEVRLRRFVFERPTAIGRMAAPLMAICATFLVLGLALATRGWEQWRIARQPVATRTQLGNHQAAMKDWRYPQVCLGGQKVVGALAVCRVGDGGSASVLVIGDSHAQQLAQRYATLSGAAIDFATREGCPPVPGVERVASVIDCKGFEEGAFRMAASGKYSRVVVTGAWGTWFSVHDPAAAPVVCFRNQQGCDIPRTAKALGDARQKAFARLVERLTALKAVGIEPVLLLDLPSTARGDPRSDYRDVYFGRPGSPETFDLADWRARNGAADMLLARTSRAAGVRLVDPALELCALGACPMRDGDRTLQRDTNHFRGTAMGGSRFAFLDDLLLARF